MPKFVVNKIHPSNPFMAYQCCVGDSEQARLAYDATPIILKKPEIDNWLYINFGWVSPQTIAQWESDIEQKVRELLAEHQDFLFKENTFSFLLCHPRAKIAWIIQQGVQLIGHDFCNGGITTLKDEDIQASFDLFRGVNRRLKLYLAYGSFEEI